jgi:hypothetical protein
MVNTTKIELAILFDSTIGMSTFESCGNKFLPNVREVLFLSPEEVDTLSGTVNFSLAYVTLA